MAAFDAYLSGDLEDPEFDEAAEQAALATLPTGVPVIA
jgi:tryptophan synthase beta chain